jgi:flavin reductase (DIM6/NTAB) family NADH-FMN oxidoreductase RutF
MAEAIPGFRAAMSHFATGVTIVTTAHEGAYYGLTVNAFCSVSLDPCLVLISLDRGSQTYAMIQRSQVYTVNMLTARHQHLAERFARKDTGTGKAFGDIQLHTQETGAPIFDEALAYVECRVVAEYPGGDHALLLGEVIALKSQPMENVEPMGDDALPLLYYRSQFGIPGIPGACQPAAPVAAAARAATVGQPASADGRAARPRSRRAQRRSELGLVVA